MNKYVSPIMELEFIDVEDIMTSVEDDTTGDTTINPGQGENELPIVPSAYYFD